ncbi:MAG TPA: DUF1343 domain-containing protein [Bacteroidia bacterium]|nr:DUF1343 domain-containing protein [Bacteroidia bacterium]
MRHIFFLFLLIVSLASPAQVIIHAGQNQEKNDSDITTGAERTEIYLPWLQGKNVALVVNQTSMINRTHLIDTLLSLNIKVKKIFCPEHGLRGDADNGEDIANFIDKKSGLPVISLYGNHLKPDEKDLKGIDVVVYDIQDVGCRFYTYITTMSYVMEACALNKKTMIILDRPDPNGYYVDGPVLEPANSSFVGLHQVPIVYGMTVAEYALMVNGEKWLPNGIQCDLKYVNCVNYVHSDWYQLPIAPSPNLPNMEAVYLYPTLCLFEGTIMSIGRGTDHPFQCVGHPDLKTGIFDFTPKPTTGAKSPLYNGQVCHGHDLRDFATLYVRDYQGLYLYWLLSTYKDMNRPDFFNDFFVRLAGTSTLQQQIIAGATEETIRGSWQPGLIKFKAIRKKYLLYTDFE